MDLHCLHIHCPAEGPTMANKKKSSPTDDLVSLVSVAPWWVGLSLAVASYFVCRRFVHQTVVQNPSNPASSILRTLVPTLARVGSWCFR